MKKTLIYAMFIYGSSLFAGEPFLLNKDKGTSFFDSEPKLEMKKKKKSQATESGESNIAIKMNLTQLAFKNLSFQGEYGFSPKMSVALGVSFLLNRNVPGFIGGDGDEFFGPMTYGGYAITPEFRFYPGAREDRPAPNGFYLAPYIRYAKYTINQNVTYVDDKGKRWEADAKQSYGGFNGGLMIGRQWIIGDHFSLDWWIIGAGYGKAKYTYSWEVPGADLTQKEQDEYRTEVTQFFDTFSFFGADTEVTTTNNSATATVRGLPMYSFRFMGLCLGYAF